MAMSCERPCDYTASRSRNIPPRWPRHSMAKAGFTAHLIDDNSGIGTDVKAADLNGDGKPDVLVGNKRGAFIFLRK